MRMCAFVRSILATCTAIAAAGLGSSASANVPQMVTHQGRLYDASEKPITRQTLSVTFALYCDPTTTTAVWTETDSGHVRRRVLLREPRSRDAVSGGSVRWLACSTSASRWAATRK